MQNIAFTFPSPLLPLGGSTTPATTFLTRPAQCTTTTTDTTLSSVRPRKATFTRLPDHRCNHATVTCDGNAASNSDTIMKSTEIKDIGQEQQQQQQQQQLENLRRVYKAAKAEYKQYKCNGTVDPTKLMELELVYKTKKTEYKTMKQGMKKREGNRRMMIMNEGEGEGEGEVEAEFEICGGKTCMKMGAQVVASMLLGKNGTPNSKCMKQCGGVGPTIQIKGQSEIVKVDIKRAVSQAIETKKHAVSSFEC